MKVLGIDPGTHRLGWAVVEGTPNKQQSLQHGCLDLPPGSTPSFYLPKIFRLVNRLISTHSPDVLGLETLLFQKNLKTAVTVAEARGVIELSAAQQSLSVVQLAPNTIKSCVAGHGGASKVELARMVGLLLETNVTNLLDDEVDALAIAMSTIITYQPKL